MIVMIVIVMIVMIVHGGRRDRAHVRLLLCVPVNPSRCRANAARRSCEALPGGRSGRLRLLRAAPIPGTTARSV